MEFDQLLALLQPFQSFRPKRFEPCDQDTIGTIPFANPDDTHSLRLEQPTINKILILADDDELLFTRVLPYDRIIHRLQVMLHDVTGLMPPFLNPARQGRRELGINQEVHAA